MARDDMPGEVGSEQHYNAYKAEYEMKQKTEEMRGGIAEVCAR